jgi:hypothetical protein
MHANRIMEKETKMKQLEISLSPNTQGSLHLHGRHQQIKKGKRISYPIWGVRPMPVSRAALLAAGGLARWTAPPTCKRKKGSQLLTASDVWSGISPCSIVSRSLYRAKQLAVIYYIHFLF